MTGTLTAFHLLFLLTIPFEPIVFGFSINVHLVLEYLAFFVAFRYYLHLRKSGNDTISYTNRLTIILGAAVGAFVGSRVIGWLENPFLATVENIFLALLNTKTIMGGLFGGLLGVEIAKWKIGEKQSSGDLFTLPIIVGIFIGRIGCFLSGTNEFTYGSSTSLFTGMDLGDGIQRHPIALYELAFLIILFVFLQRLPRRVKLPNGYMFQLFMLTYFGFRFLIEFIKPNMFFILGLSTIQWLCIVCFIYYRRTILKATKYAGKKLHLL